MLQKLWCPHRFSLLYFPVHCMPLMYQSTLCDVQMIQGLKDVLIGMKVGAN
uniref:Uncharacterized protein n=1 Tax=Arundo donax TaxID=35708 RepID=A0A0A8ZDT4_ARUDO